MSMEFGALSSHLTPIHPISPHFTLLDLSMGVKWDEIG